MLRQILALFVAASLVLAQTRPAFADAARPNVQPVPYKSSQPVQYGVSGSSTAPASPPPPAPPPAPPVVTSAGGATLGVVGNDVVHLKDGGVMRGTLVEAIPNDHATLHLATGQNAIIPWRLIDHIEANAAPLPPPSTNVEEDGRQAAFVHIDSPDPVTLERNTTNGWQFACSSPCDRNLSLDYEYRLVGSGIRTTGVFHLQARPGDRIELQVNPSSRGAFVGGIILVSTGPVVMLVGLVVLLVAATESIADTCFSTTSSVCSNQHDSGSGGTVGALLLVGGAAMIIGGIVMIASNAHSGVAQQPLERAQPPRDAWLRLPTWHEDSMAVAAPKAASVPVWNVTF
jgi:hypothetical protein